MDPATLTLREGRPYKVDAKEVETDDLTVNSGGSITFNSDLDVDADFKIRTAGGGSDSITFRDTANGVDSLTIQEGENAVNIPNGLKLNVGVGTLEGNGGGNARLDIGQGANNIQLNGSNDFIAHSFNTNDTIRWKGVVDTADGMTADPETASEDGFIEATLPNSSGKTVQIPYHDA